MNTPDYQQYSLGELPLECGAHFPRATLAYKTWGALNPQRDNAVLLASFITGTHQGYDFLIGPGRCLDPARYFVIATNLFGNGLSSSPSNTPPPFSGPDFPLVTIRDNVRAQHQLVFEELGVRSLALAAGFSIGAQQAYQWAVSHPGEVERVAAWCGHAHTTPHTRVFLDGLIAVIKESADWNQGHYKNAPVRGLRACARAYAGWGTSQAWYREELWTQLGFAGLGEFVVGFWESFFTHLEANDLIAQMETWKAHNVGDTPGFNGNYHAALASVQAHVLVMPCVTDLYFPPDDAEEEAGSLPRKTVKRIDSSWGHWAGFGMNDPDREFITQEITRLLGTA